MPVSVNVSTRTLAEIELPTVLDNLLRDRELPERALELEITETVLLADPARSRAVLRALEDRGTRILLDDFGTGHSTLAYLRKLPLYAVKIDQVFVASGLVDDADRRLPPKVKKERKKK